MNGERRGRREGAETIVKYRAYGFTSIETCLLHWEQVRLDELRRVEASVRKKQMTRKRQALFREQKLYLEAQMMGLIGHNGEIKWYPTGRKQLLFSRIQGMRNPKRSESTPILEAVQ